MGGFSSTVFWAFLILVWGVWAHAIDSDGDDSVMLVKEVKPGWVRFCSAEKRFDIFSNQCPVGFFWKPNFKVAANGWDCVCSRGAWRRSNKWCSTEDVQRFVQGDVTCFVPEKNLEGMLYLGDQHSAWDSSEPVLLSSYKSGFTIRADDFKDKWKVLQRNNDDAGILIVRPKDDWTVEDQNNPKIKLCLRAPIPTFAEEFDGLYIYNVSSFFSKENAASEFKLSFKRTCFSWKKNDGNTWYEIIGESIEDKNMVMPQYNNKTATDACRKCMSITIPDAPKTDVYGKALKGPEKKTVYDLKNVAVLTSEINLQSERLGLYWTNRLLRKDATDYAKGDFQELEILEKAAVLAYGACNMKYIPKEFYQYFLVMFRKLLSESFQKYAPASPINPEYYKKILDLLEQCKKRTKPIDFVVDKGCPEKYSKYQKYKVENDSHPIPKVVDYSAEPAKHDYLLEFVWRLKSFLHYQCFPEFKDDSVLHDLIQNQLESIFTEDIVLRWFNPSMAFRMYDQIFQTSLDLKTTMTNFEKCVRVVHDVNKFPVWLKRPIDQPHRVQQALFAKKRRRRAADEEQDGFDGAMSLESEFTDMALENIRQKRVLSSEDEETTTTSHTESDESSIMPEVSTSKIAEDSTKISTSDESMSTTPSVESTLSVSSDEENETTPTSISGKSSTAHEVTTTQKTHSSSAEETTQIPATASGEESTQMLTATTSEQTTQIPIKTSTSDEETTQMTTSEEKIMSPTVSSLQVMTLAPTASSSEEISTTLSTPISTPGEDVTTISYDEATTLSDDEIRWKREQAAGSSIEDVTEPSTEEISTTTEPSFNDETTTDVNQSDEMTPSTENASGDEVTTTPITTTIDKSGSDANKLNDDNEDSEEHQTVISGKAISSELSSIEALYIDSAEAKEGLRPGPTDKVWNKFTADDEEGFMGSCITTMSSFAKESKRNMEECW